MRAILGIKTRRRDDRARTPNRRHEKELEIQRRVDLEIQRRMVGLRSPALTRQIHEKVLLLSK